MSGIARKLMGVTKVSGGGDVWTDPDLANASYDGVSFSVAGEDSAPASVVFKPDGLKMYVVGQFTDAVYQYTLSTAWDVGTASYDSVSFSVSGQAGLPSIQFGDSGEKLYVSDNTSDAIYQYSLSTAWDISTASYDSVSFSVSGQDTTPQGMFFKHDGTKLYLVGFANDSVFQYSLSTAWDLSSISYDSVSFSFLAQETQGRSLFLSPDGTKLFIVGTGSDTVYQYSLSTAWDISTAAYDSVGFSVASQETTPLGLFFKSDGSKMYVVGSGTDTIYQYSTAAAAPAEWTDPDLANASYDSVSFSVAGQEASVRGIFFKPDGTKMYVIGESGDDVNEYDLSTAWVVSSASFLQSFSIAAQETSPTSIFFKTDGTKMYVLGRQGDDVNEYDLSTAWEVSSASFVQNFSVASQDNLPWGFFFKPDGTKMYVLGQQGDDVNEYDLSTAWNVSTASFVQNFSVATQETTPTEINFNPDGTKMFIIGTANDSVYEYDLSTAWDVSTAVYNSVSFSVAAQEINPFAFRFKSDGSKMYVLGFGTTVYQYSTA